jgi:site-specific DNA recombinase
MQAVAYVRVSTEEQVQGTSLDNQVKACQEFAKSQGTTLHKDSIFREEGVSARIIDRPQLTAMLDFCAKNKGKVTHCIVWKVDRLARKSEFHHIIKAKLLALGVKLVSVTEPIGDDPVGNLMDGMLAAFAQFDNDVRTARTTGGMRARTMQGGWPHSPPFGYRSAKTPTGITTVAPSDDAPKITRFLEEFSTGSYTVKQAVDLGFEMGIQNKNGKKLYWQSIKNIICNPLYAGYVCTKFTDDEMIKGLHEPLISERIYYKNLAVVNGKSKNFSREAVEDWPLRSGFLKHACGTPMTGSSPRGRSGPSPRYSCPKCRTKEIGGPTSRMRESVHKDFIELLSSIRPSKGTERLFKEIVLREWNQEFRHGIELSSKIDQELSALSTKKSRIIDLFIDGKLSDDEKDIKMTEVESRANRLKLQKAEAKEYVANKEEIIDGALLFMSDPAIFWSQSSIEIKRRVQDSIFPEGLVYDCKDGFGTIKLSESYLLIKKIASEEAKNPNLVAATRLELVTPGL